MSASRICSYVLLSAGFAVSSIVAQVNGGTEVPRKPNASMGPMGGMPVVAPLFIEDQQRTSTIVMVNNAPDSVDLDVVLYSLKGNQVGKQAVSLRPHSQKTVFVANILQDSGTQYGSVFLIPHRNTTMAAQVSISGRNGASAGDIEEELVMLMSPTPANYRAVSMSASPIVAITSLSATNQTVSVGCLSGHNGNVRGELSIGPNQTVLVDACAKGGPVSLPALPGRPADSNGDLSGDQGAVAVSVSSPGASMDLAVFGVGPVGPASAGRFVAIPFTDINSLKSSTAVYSGVAGSGMSATSVSAAIANFGGQNRLATILLSEGSGTGTPQRILATVMLAPYSVSVAGPIDISTPTTASLLVTSGGAPGEVVSGIQAVGTPGGPGDLTLPWRDRGQGNNGGQHPWRIDGGFKSTVLLFNPDADEANSVKLTAYAGGKTWSKLVPVPPQATVAIEMNGIIEKQEPDDTGNKLPRDSIHGIVAWFTLTNPRIFGQLVEADMVGQIVRPFACAEYYAVCAATINSVTEGVGDNNEIYAAALTCGTNGDCSCVESCGTTGNATFSNWYSSDSSVANLDNVFGSTAYMQGDTVGTTFTSVTATDSNGCSGSGGGQVTVDCPYITNFSEALQSAPSDGTLVFNYTWTSSTGTQADLKSCTVGETVFYPGSSNPYSWPAPMVSSTVNPTLLSGAGTNAGFIDRNLPPTRYSTPYAPGSFFAAMQRFWWHCSCYMNDGLQYPFPDKTINRKVFQDTDSVWKYQITKSGQTNTVALP